MVVSIVLILSSIVTRLFEAVKIALPAVSTVLMIESGSIVKTEMPLYVCGMFGLGDS